MSTNFMSLNLTPEKTGFMMSVTVTAESAFIIDETVLRAPLKIPDTHNPVRHGMKLNLVTI